MITITLMLFLLGVYVTYNSYQYKQWGWFALNAAFTVWNLYTLFRLTH